MRYFTLFQILNVLTCTIAFTNIAITTKQVHSLKKSTELWGFFDDLFKSRTSGGDLNDKDKQPRQDRLEEDAAIRKTNDEMGFSEKDLRKEIERRKAADNLGGQESNVITSVSSSEEEEEEREFDGYMVSVFFYVTPFIPSPQDLPPSHFFSLTY
jgi:Hepatitis delta virus delta antigen.